MNRVPDSQLLTLTLIEEERKEIVRRKKSVERQREEEAKSAFEMERIFFSATQKDLPFREKFSKANVIELEG